MSQNAPLQGRRRPTVVALLQLVPGVGGLGYARLGQWRKAGITFLGVGLLIGADIGASLLEGSAPMSSPGLGSLVTPVLGHIDTFKLAAMFLGPSAYVLQVLTALDAWQLAQRLNAGEAVGRGDTTVPLLEG